MNTQRIEQGDRLMESYVSTIKAALIGLLLGGGCLALAKFLPWPRASAGHPIVPSLTEFLGWGLLASTAATLLHKWMSSHRVHVVTVDLVESELFGHRFPAGETKAASLRSRTIDGLYAELRPLMSRAATDPSLTEEVQAKLSRLRQLQTEEADEMEERFKEGLLLKPGEGQRALEQARKLLARYENPSSPDSPTFQKS